MKCIKCGHELKDGAVYCIRCGTMQVSMEGERLSAKDLADSEKPIGMRHAREFEQPPSNNGKRIAIVVVVLVVVAAIVAILAYTCMGQKKSEDDSANAAASAVFSSQSASSTATSTTSSTASSTASSAASSTAASSSAASSAASQSAAAQNQPATQEQQPQPQPQPAPEPEPEPQPQVGDQPSYAPQPTSGDYVLGDSSSRYYSRDELESMSASDLYYARNEIFARHGRMFHRSDLQSYFESKSWYNPTYTPAEWDAMGDQLSDVERQNSQLMAEVEASKNSGYL